MSDKDKEQKENGLKDYGIIYISGPINGGTAEGVCKEIIDLNIKGEVNQIQMIINSPGGSITAGMSIYDTMNFIKPDISTLCIGQAASMGAFLLSAGTQGKRFALTNSRVMIHQPLLYGGGLSGQVTDIEIHARELVKVKAKMNELLAKHSGQTMERLQADTERDNFMSAEQALAYGLIDKVLTSRAEVAA